MSIPAECVKHNMPDWDIDIVAYQTELKEVIIHFEVRTTTACVITDWPTLCKIAQERAEAQWLARNNARAIGDMQVTKEGKIIHQP